MSRLFARDFPINQLREVLPSIDTYVFVHNFRPSKVLRVYCGTSIKVRVARAWSKNKIDDYLALLEGLDA